MDEVHGKNANANLNERANFVTTSSYSKSKFCCFFSFVWLAIDDEMNFDQCLLYKRGRKF